jgi:Zn-dependent metalloprotease
MERSMPTRNAVIVAFACALTATAQVRIPATLAAKPRQVARTTVPSKVQAAFGALAGDSERPKIAVRANGSLRSASNFESRFYGGEPEEAARSFVQENPNIFGGPLPPVLRVRGLRSIAGHTAVRLQQTVDDIPVLGREVVLTIRENRVRAILSHISTGERRGTWTLSPDDAVSAARAFREMKEPRIQSVQKAWFGHENGLVPAWAVTMVEADHSGEWMAVVNGIDGSVLEFQNLRHGDRTAKGYAFQSNPVKSPMVSVNLPGLTDPKWLAGVYADIYSYYPVVKGGADSKSLYAMAVPDSSGNYPYTPPDPRFAEVQAYYGVDRVARYFDSIGFPGLGKPIKVVVWYMDCRASTCKPINNAYFSSAIFDGEGGLCFGINADETDPIYDADVIYHEFTHAVVNDIVGSYQSAAFDALNEGFADYFSDSAMNDPNLGEYGALIWNTRTPYIRTADNRNRFPRNLAGEVHIDGNIWSGALWDIRKAVGAAAADEIALVALASLTSTSEFYDAATAAVNAAGWLYGRKVSQTVETLLSARGLLGDSAEMAADAHEIGAGKLPVVNSAPGDPSQVGYFAGRQFKFYVPSGAQAFTLKIVANTKILGLVKHRSPAVVYDDGSFNAEYYAGPASTLTIHVDETSDPEIQAGWHYVWVAQLGSRDPVEYGLLLGIDYGSNKPTATRATVLTVNGNPASGSAPVGQYLNSREFIVQAPSNATGLGIRVDGDTDVDLYVKYGGAVRNNSQGFPDGDVARTSSSKSETAILTRNTIPALQPGGTYVIGVYNFDDNATAHFTVRAVSTDAPDQPVQVKPLAAGATATLTFSQAYGAAVLSPQQFTLAVPASAKGMRIRVDTDIDALCYVRAGRVVTVGTSVAADYSFRSTDRKTYDITLSSPTPLKAGTYYLAVASPSDKGGTVSVSYSIY